MENPERHNRKTFSVGETYNKDAKTENAGNGYFSVRVSFIYSPYTE
jgi:hypothetical protein